jgi:hypothetical protein
MTVLVLWAVMPYGLLVGAKISALNMELVYPSETLALMYKPTRRHNSDGHRREYLGVFLTKY